MDDSDENGREEAPRVCNNGLATAITSIFTAAVVLQLEVLRPCLISNSVSCTNGYNEFRDISKAVLYYNPDSLHLLVSAFLQVQSGIVIFQ